MIIIILFIIFILLIILSCLRNTELFTTSTTNVNIPVNNRDNYIINNEFKIDKDNTLDIKKINASRLCIRNSNTDNIECISREELYNFLKLNTFRKNSVCIDDACIDKNSVKLLNGSKPIRFKNLSEEGEFEEKCIGYDVFDAHTCKNKSNKSCKNIVNTNPWITIDKSNSDPYNYKIYVGPSDPEQYSKTIKIKKDGIYVGDQLINTEKNSTGHIIHTNLKKFFDNESAESIDYIISTKKEIVNDIEEDVVIVFNCVDGIRCHYGEVKKKFKYDIKIVDNPAETTQVTDAADTKEYHLTLTRIDEFKPWTENIYIFYQKKKPVKCYGDFRFKPSYGITFSQIPVSYNYNKYGNEKPNEYNCNRHTIGDNNDVCRRMFKKRWWGTKRWCDKVDSVWEGYNLECQCRDPIVEDDGTKKSTNLDDYKFPIQSLVPETCGKNNSSNFTLSPGLMVSGIDPNFKASNEENNYYNSNLFTDHH
jgi:hypothetical protein